jgi:hypothetical protein
MITKMDVIQDDTVMNYVCLWNNGNLYYPPMGVNLDKSEWRHGDTIDPKVVKDGIVNAVNKHSFRNRK